MSKPEALVDTCFLQKFSRDGKDAETLKSILENLEFRPVIHPYIWKHELSMFSYVEKLIKDGMIRVATYEEFLAEEDRELYLWQFLELYKELGEYYKVMNISKPFEKLPEDCDIFTYRKAKTSLGDVHVILMAAYAEIPVVFTEDGDISALRSIAKRRIDSESYQITIYDALDALGQIIEKSNCPFSKKDVEHILNVMGERSERSRMKKLWDQYHENL